VKFIYHERGIDKYKVVFQGKYLGLRNTMAEAEKLRDALIKNGTIKTLKKIKCCDCGINFFMAYTTVNRKYCTKCKKKRVEANNDEYFQSLSCDGGY